MTVTRPEAMRGFTMVELIIVMLLMGIVSAVALPRFMDRTALYERGFRDQLKGMLQYARKVAVTQQRGTCVLVLLGTNPTAQVVYAGGGGCNTAAPVAEPGQSQPFVASIPSGVNVAGNLAVQFDTSGRPVPNANSTITVGSGLQLIVNRETGFVLTP